MILPARPSDLAAVARIAEEAFPVPWPRSELQKELERPHARLVVLRPGPDAKLAAFINYWRVGDELEVMNVCTALAERRRGHGRALVEYVLAEARAQGLSRVRLEVRAGNRAALALYAGLGFERIGVRPSYYSDNGEDAICMVCSL